LGNLRMIVSLGIMVWSLALAAIATAVEDLHLANYLNLLFARLGLPISEELKFVTEQEVAHSKAFKELENSMVVFKDLQHFAVASFATSS
jgi:hypothetical protein